jgi:PAS domain S-box-containing protein
MGMENPMTEKRGRESPAADGPPTFSRDLAENSSDLFTLFNENPVPTILSEIPSGAIVFVNKRMAGLLKRKLADIIGKTAAQLGLLKNPADLEKLTELLVGRGHADNVEVEKIFPDGSRGTDLVSMRIVPVNGTPYCLTAVQDITAHKQTQDALHESENRFRKIVEQAPISMAIISMDGTIEFINQKAVAVFGYVLQDIPTLDRWWVLAYPNENYRKEVISDWTERVNSAVAAGREIRGNEYRVTCKDGTTKITFISGVPVSGKILVMFDDITERWMAEESLRESEERFSKAFKTSPYAYVIANADDGAILDVNDAFTTMSGFTREESLAGSTLNLKIWVNEEDRQRMVDSLRNGHAVVGMETKVRAKNGDVKTVLLSAQVLRLANRSCILSIVQDITEQKKAENSLIASEQKYRELANTVPVGIFEFDYAGKLTFVNTTLYEWFGFTEAEVEAGINILDLADVSDRQRLKENMAHIVTLGTSPPREYCLIRKNGDKIQVLALTKPILAQGHVQGFRGILLDLTEKKKMEFAIQNAAKLDALGVLAGGIAHDFNNMLTGFFGYVGLARTMSKDAQVNEYLETTIATMNRARALTLQLLTFAKGGAPVQRVTSLNPFIQETSQFALSGSNVSCRFDIPEVLWPCNIDKNQIGQVIDNIVINAQQAMPGGGSIGVMARNVSLGENEHASLARGNYVKVSFKDAGIGIPKEILPRIFDPFYTTKPKGHGLGLATCYSIVNRHGGYIDVESEPGKGSTFHVYLPASAEAPAADATAGIVHRGSGTFIVMDDEKVIRSLFRKILESLGYTVQCAGCGQEAIDLLVKETAAGRAVSAMIFDLTVPGAMGGKEAVAEIRKINREIPVFVASGYSNDPVMTNPTRYGFTASIRKPFSTTELMEMLEKYLKPK